MVEPGWYEDPTDSSMIRWFDGNAWTETTKPNVAAFPPPAGPRVNEVAGSATSTAKAASNLEQKITELVDQDPQAHFNLMANDGWELINSATSTYQTGGGINGFSSYVTHTRYTFTWKRDREEYLRRQEAVRLAKAQRAAEHARWLASPQGQAETQRRQAQQAAEQAAKRVEQQAAQQSTFTRELLWLPIAVLLLVALIVSLYIFALSYR